MGGKIHLLGVFSFLILVLAVYTANLAAILTTSAQSHAVESLEEALEAGYTFCINRKIQGTVSSLYNIDADRFVVDPEHEGGDGKPGFNCGNCQARQRTLDFMKQNSDDPSLYCDAAIVTQQDLQVFHQYGLHCNKTVVGDILTFITYGMPITGDLSSEMMSWLYKMKYEGLLTEHLRQSEPESQCAAKEQQSEGIGLTVPQLTGIWVIVFTCAVGGLLAKAFTYCEDQTKKDKTVEVQKVLVYDQWGRAMENLELKRAGGNAGLSMREAAWRNVPNYVNPAQAPGGCGGSVSYHASTIQKRPSISRFSITSRNDDDQGAAPEAYRYEIDQSQSHSDYRQDRPYSPMALSTKWEEDPSMLSQPLESGGNSTVPGSTELHSLDLEETVVSSKDS